MVLKASKVEHVILKIHKNCNFSPNNQQNPTRDLQLFACRKSLSTHIFLICELRWSPFTIYFPKLMFQNLIKHFREKYRDVLKYPKNMEIWIFIFRQVKQPKTDEISKIRKISFLGHRTPIRRPCQNCNVKL